MQRQPSSKMCFCCGRENPIGLRLKFDFDGERVWTSFSPQPPHQGYPGILHGGIAYAILDEVMGRVAIAHNLWMVTAKMEVRYRQPIPLEGTLTAVGEIVERKRRLMTARGELRLPDGTVAAEALGTFVEAPSPLQTEWQAGALDWRVDDEDASDSEGAARAP